MDLSPDTIITGIGCLVGGGMAFGIAKKTSMSSGGCHDRMAEVHKKVEDNEKHIQGQLNDILRALGRIEGRLNGGNND